MKTKPTINHYCGIVFKPSIRRLEPEMFILTEKQAKRFKKQAGEELLLLEINHKNFQKPKVIK